MQHADTLDSCRSDPGRHPRALRQKIRKLSPHQEDKSERARIRAHIQEGLRDPERFLDLARERKNMRGLLASGRQARLELLESQKQRVKSELRNTRDLDTFLMKTSRSKTLHALVALAFFRHVRDSDAYAEEHRYKQAIRRALEEPDRSKAIHWKWESFDKEFPGPAAKLAW